MLAHSESDRVAYDRRIDAVHLSPDEYESYLHDPFVGERLTARSPLLVVEGPYGRLATPGSLPVIVCAIGDELGGTGPDNADLVVDTAHLDTLIDRVAGNPVAATSLAVLLRTSASLPVELALGAESAVYSMLQGGDEFVRWRAGVTAELGDDEGPTVLVERDGDVVTISLNRPHRHNAISRALRDDLCAALEVGLLDGTVGEIHLRGEGPSFCSGGDLTEFGARPDPAAAHRTRLAQSPARLIHALRGRMIAHLHGSTLGGGIEMAAFAGRVVADPATRIGLPEVGLGLIPGAGGTASITRRVGRQRTAALALAVDTIDAETALDWGLVDEVRAVPSSP